MHLPHILQGTIQNRNGNISALNGALWDMGQVHREFGLLPGHIVRRVIEWRPGRKQSQLNQGLCEYRLLVVIYKLLGVVQDMK